MRVLIIILTVLSSSIVGFSQSTLADVDIVITQDDIKAHLTYLASDELKGRDTGSEGLEAAAAYAKAHFIRYGIGSVDGLDGYFQPVPFRRFSPPTEAVMKVNGQSLTFPDDFIVINGGKVDMSSPVINIGFGNADEIEGKDLKMKIAVSMAGDGVNQDPRNWVDISAEKRKRAMDAGALALVEIYQSTSVPWMFLKNFGTQSQMSVDNGREENELPNYWIGTTDSLAITSLKTDDTMVRIETDGVDRDMFTSANVVGMIPGTDPALSDEYIVYSAHYDHVGIGRADATGDTIYNGTRDNAVGTTAVLSLAKYFSKNPPRRSSIFVLFTAEEKGLLGSRHFTENLPVAADKIKYNYNIDNGGYNDTTIISVIGLTRTEAEDDIQSAVNMLGLEAIEDAAGEQGLFDRSDNVNFAKLGIPAPTFSLGFRSFDEEIFKYYHQPGDEVETVNMNYIEKYVKAYILSAEKIANRDEAPFWKQGDKYYETGVELYGKE